MSRPCRMVLAASGQNPTATVMLWGGLVLVLLAVFAGVVYWLRRRLLDSGGGSGDPTPWDLANLQALRDAGQLSQEEYEVLRANSVAALRQTLGTDGGASPDRGGDGTGD